LFELAHEGQRYYAMNCLLALDWVLFGSVLLSWVLGCDSLHKLLAVVVLS
jgi:hypothetical protein